MIKRVSVLLCSLVFIACATQAASSAQQKRHRRVRRAKSTTAARLTEVRVCPWNGEAVIGDGQAQEQLGRYKIYFCCEEHKPEFDRLTAAEKQQRIEDALRKQRELKKSQP